MVLFPFVTLNNENKRLKFLTYQFIKQVRVLNVESLLIKRSQVNSSRGNSVDNYFVHEISTKMNRFRYRAITLAVTKAMGKGTAKYTENENKKEENSGVELHSNGSNVCLLINSPYKICKVRKQINTTYFVAYSVKNTCILLFCTICSLIYRTWLSGNKLRKPVCATKYFLRSRSYKIRSRCYEMRSRRYEKISSS